MKNITAACVADISHALACYNAKEFEAEQGLRIHSELMVIGLTCIKMPNGQALYNKYQNFTRKNASLISAYETALIRHYERQGSNRPEEKLHTLRTDLANEISRHAVSMSTLSFCQKFAANLDQALAMSPDKLRRWAQQIRPNQPTTEPVCTQTSRRS
jgi:hypothetical protein